MMQNRMTAYTLLLTQGLSLIGSRMTGIAIGIWLFQTTGKTTYLLLVPFFNEIPTLLIGNICGVYIDRWKRKTSLVIGDVGQAVGSLLLLISIALNIFKPWMLYSAVLLQGIFSMLQGAAADTTMTLLITEANRERINGIKEMLFPAAGVIAPMLTALAYPLVGIKGIITMDLITFLIAIIILTKLDIPNPKGNISVEGSNDSLKSDLKTGYRFLKDHKLLFGLILYFSFTNFLLNGPLELVIPYVMQLTESEVAVSMMLSVMSIGTFCGAMTIAVLGRIGLRMHIILGAMIINGLMLIVFGIVRTPITLGISLFFLMMPLPIVSALFKSILQIKVPADLQGRVFSISYQIAYGSAPLSFLLVGPLVDNILEPKMQSGMWPWLTNIFGEIAGAGMGLALSCAGVIIIATTIAFSLCRNFRRLESKLPDYKY
ncbi:MFS transporter [Wukongibacter baidiensis]